MDQGHVGKAGLVVVLLIVIGGCGGPERGAGTSDAAAQCVPGRTVQCQCGGSATGRQRCGKEGTWEACVCDAGRSGGENPDAGARDTSRTDTGIPGEGDAVDKGDTALADAGDGTGRDTRPQTPVTTVELPMLVYPKDGASSFQTSTKLHVESPEEVERLWVQAHQPFYHRGGVEKGVSEGFDPEGAASVQVNGGTWVDVRDENVDCAFPESEYWCVAGGYSTIRFTIPVDDIEAGLNTVSFRFNGTQGVRSGYRVLDLDLVGENGTSKLTRTEFAHPAYQNWEPPYTSRDAIEAGETLFEKRQELVDNPLSGETMHAACNDCHTNSGMDLAYFNYSNRVLEARSRFHGLSKKQGKQIASYIRSIDLKKRDGSTYEAPGTPWDPPYQPGPTLMATGKPPGDSDQVYWAAGAGLDAVLDRDEEMLAHMFPKDGDPSNGVDWTTDGDGDQRLPWEKHIDLDDSLNQRVMPIAMQLPDWNNWLPDIHPIDNLGPKEYRNTGAVETLFGGDGTLRQRIENYDGGRNQDELMSLDRAMQGFTSAFHNGPLQHFASDELTSSEKAEALNSAFRWKAVKLWQIHHGHHLQDVTDEAYGAPRTNGFMGDRMWMGTNRTLFDIGPHISRYNKWKAPHTYGTNALDFFMTHPWYQLQVVVNPGSDPATDAQNPVDWNYQRMFTAAAADGTGVGAAVRNYQSIIMRWQLLSNDRGVNGKSNNDEPVAHGGITNAWGPDPSQLSFINDMVEGALHNEGIWKNLEPETLGAMYTAALAAWNDYNMRFEPSEFPRSSDRNTYPPSDYQVWEGDRVRQYSWVEQIYAGTQKAYRYLGVDREVLQTTYDWGGKMWPDNDWSSRMESGHASVGDGNGLKAEIFEGSDLSGQPVETRVDEHVVHKWEDGASPDSVSGQQFAMRWTGELQPFFTEKLHLYFKTTDGLRVWLDGQKIIDTWGADNYRWAHHVTKKLTQGKRYPIRIEFKARSGDSYVQFRWGGTQWLSHPGKRRQQMRVPPTQLYPSN